MKRFQNAFELSILIMKNKAYVIHFERKIVAITSQPRPSRPLKILHCGEGGGGAIIRLITL